jgi:hypothetical protein
MDTVYHTSYKFTTNNTFDPKESLSNRLGMLEKNGDVYFLQYIQCRIDAGRLYWRKYNLLADRLYFLEVSNGTLDDRERRRRFFSLLGRRRFGANDELYDLYTPSLAFNLDAFIKVFASIKECSGTNPVQYERADKNLNRYEAWLVPFENEIYAVMEQTNTLFRQIVQQMFCHRPERQRPDAL